MFVVTKRFVHDNGIIFFSNQNCYSLISECTGKIICLNCREQFEHMFDQGNYIHNLSSCEIKA